jgi:hypothetical protein
MERDKLVELTAQQTGVPEDTAAEVLKVAKLIEAKDLLGDQRQPVEAVEGKDLVEQADTAGQADAVEDVRSPDALDQATLDKADEAFGGPSESGRDERTYSERSGLLA